MSDMKKLLEAIDSMDKAEKKPTGPKFPGYWKGTDPASKAKDKMVGSAQESIIKELDKTAKDTATERKLKEEFANFQGVAEDKGMKQYWAFKREWRAKHGANAKVPGYDSKEYNAYCWRQGDEQIKNNKFNHKADDWSQDFERRMKQGVAEDHTYYDDIYPQYGGAYVNGRSDDARMTARLTRQAKAAAKKAGKTFSSSEEYRGWYVRQQERQERLARQKEKKGVAEGMDDRQWFNDYADWKRVASQLETDDDGQNYVRLGGNLIAHWRGNDGWVDNSTQGVAEGSDGADKVTLDIPLLIRMLEYAREDAQTDLEIHDVAERMIDLSQEGRTLTMDDYTTICPPEQIEEYGNAQNPNAQTTTPGVAGSAQADAQNDAGATTELVNTQKNLSKLKTVDPTLNPQLANQALQTIGTNPAATVGGAQLKQTQNLADLVGDALADPQRGSQLATILQQVQTAKRAK